VLVPDKKSRLAGPWCYIYIYISWHILGEKNETHTHSLDPIGGFKVLFFPSNLNRLILNNWIAYVDQGRLVDTDQHLSKSQPWSSCIAYFVDSEKGIWPSLSYHRRFATSIDGISFMMGCINIFRPLFQGNLLTWHVFFAQSTTVGSWWNGNSLTPWNLVLVDPCHHHLHRNRFMLVDNLVRIPATVSPFCCMCPVFHCCFSLHQLNTVYIYTYIIYEIILYQCPS
jgi:hypothetical protein